MKNKNRISVPLSSFLILWMVVILKYATENNFDFAYLFGWIAEGLGYAIIWGAVGIIIVGGVAINIFLFFYNIFKPQNKLSFDTYKKITASLWLVIIDEIFGLIKGFI